MANAVWPASLPQDVLQGWEKSLDSGLLRTPMDQGPAKQRRRFSATARPYTVTVQMTGTQVTTFEAFFDDTIKGGSLPFDWLDPRTQTAVTFRFVKEPMERHRAGEVYQIPLQLEVLP